MSGASAVILAAGSARRMDLGQNKVFLKFDQQSAVVRCVQTFLGTGLFSSLVVVCREEDLGILCAKLDAHVRDPRCQVCVGGPERQDSVRNALALVPGDATYVAVHDAARCFVTEDVIEASLASARRYGSGVAAIPATDTIKRVAGDIVEETLDRSKLVCVQTPQTFEASVLRAAYEKAARDGFLGTDDASLVERLGVAVHVSPGSPENIKLTVPADIGLGEWILERRHWRQDAVHPRVGTGFDVHAFCKGRPLVLGGVAVPSDAGLLGHSDADVLTHAVMDALLGAAGLPDIGCLFPDTDPAYEGIRSLELLSQVGRKVREKGFSIQSIDCTLLLERPRVAPYTRQMAEGIAGALDVDASLVNVKATTLEGLGALGRGEGAGAQAVCLLEKAVEDA